MNVFLSLSLSPLLSCLHSQVFSLASEGQIRETGDVALPVSPLRYFFPSEGDLIKGAETVLVNWNGLKLEWLIPPAS